MKINPTHSSVSNERGGGSFRTPFTIALKGGMFRRESNKCRICRKDPENADDRRAKCVKGKA